VLFVDSGDPWDPNPTTVDNVMKMLKCIHRVLKPEGVFVSITFGQVREIYRQFSVSEFFWFFHLSVWSEDI
jgi:ubiquinone/menaquinone biosynthesis C-methylase UbiE